MAFSNPPPPYQPSKVLRKNTHPIKSSSFPSISKPTPTRQNSSFIASKWGIGWRTPLTMVISYILSLLLAFGHLGLFLYLSNRPADGSARAAPQSYVSTASNFLSNAFALSLKTSLAVAFTQYLWFTLRGEPMRVGTIDRLFGIRSNLFMLFDWGVVARGPVLVGIAGLIWSLQAVASFPPGALTISSAITARNGTVDVATFDASFFGNSSGFDAERFSFYGFDKKCADGDFICPDVLSLSSSPLQKLVSKTLINGAPDIMSSPCGANCSFTISLDVPYLECNSTTVEFVLEDTTLPPVFTATWKNYMLNATTYALDISGIAEDSVSQSTFPARAHMTICVPARASLTLGFDYQNNLQTMNISTGAKSRLDLQSPAPDTSIPASKPDGPQAVNFPGFMAFGPGNSGYVYGTAGLNWTTPLVAWYRDLQLLAIIDSMASLLSGVVSIDPLGGIEYTNNGTVVTSTRFHKSFGSFTLRDAPTLGNLSLPGQNAPNQIDPYLVNQQLLNQALLNMTMSIISNFKIWQARGTPMQQWKTINVYSFSKPLNLIIPYFFSLLLALPILALGAFALYRNGVPADDGGFIQAITTSTGSVTLERLASSACLGGSDNAPRELKNLKVRFGEMLGDERGGLVRRAGFGTEEETVHLVKGALYGRSQQSWI